MTPNPHSASTIYRAFPLPADFPNRFLRFLEPDDQALIEEILPPWRAIIEWMYAHGELTDCSLRLFRDMLPLREVILRRQDMPSNLREDIQRALSGACQRTDLTRGQVVDRWNSFIVTTCLSPWIDGVCDISQT